MEKYKVAEIYGDYVNSSVIVTIHGALHLAARHPASKIAFAGIRPLAVRRLFNGADALQFAAG